MAKIKKAQVGRLIKKAVSTIGKDVVKGVDKKLVKSAERDIEKTTTKGNFNAIPKSAQKPTNKMEAKIDARAKKIKKANDSYDKSVWESYQKNGGKTKKSMKMGGKIRKAQTGKTLPGVTVTSQAAPKKNLIEKVFGTKEERQDRKLDIENRRLERQANRQANRAERQGNRACRRAGRCGGRGMGFVGYNKNGGTTKKSKSSKKK